MKTLIGAFLVLTALFIHFYLPSLQTPPEPIGASNRAILSSEALNPLPPIKTESKFSEKLIEDSEILPKKVVYKDNPEVEAGIETVLEEGSNGKKTKIIKITYYQGKEYGREVVSTEIIEPKDKIVSRGTKIIWKTLYTPEGEIKYWKKIRVYATHYDSRCPGCNEWTATGMRAGKGVIAVDPKVIKLGTRVYIPGYGMAIAGDTGGAIKGHIIDLGFEDAKTAGWKAQFVDIYLLN